MTNATSSTSMTSTSGVMLISLKHVAVFGCGNGHGLAPRTLSSGSRRRPRPAAGGDALPAGAARRAGRVLREVQEVVGEVIEIRGHRLHAAHEVVERQHRRNGDRDADAGGEQRFTDGPATTSMDALPRRLMSFIADMIPHTVPNRPTKARCCPRSRARRARFERRRSRSTCCLRFRSSNSWRSQAWSSSPSLPAAPRAATHRNPPRPGARMPLRLSAISAALCRFGAARNEA